MSVTKSPGGPVTVALTFSHVGAGGTYAVETAIVPAGWAGPGVRNAPVAKERVAVTIPTRLDQAIQTVTAPVMTLPLVWFMQYDVYVSFFRTEGYAGPNMQVVWEGVVRDAVFVYGVIRASA